MTELPNVSRAFCDGHNPTIAAQKQAIVEQFGAWTAHNIHLGDDVYTIDSAIFGDEIKLRRILQIVADNARKPLDQLRGLDFGQKGISGRIFVTSITKIFTNPPVS